MIDTVILQLENRLQNVYKDISTTLAKLELIEEERDKHAKQLESLFEMRSQYVKAIAILQSHPKEDESPSNAQN